MDFHINQNIGRSLWGLVKGREWDLEFEVEDLGWGKR